ncbi:hypothetical protein QYM36_019112 [Artemia franciscana]|uniref:Uncharacterized protein n=1 Tax=Artemia franciscana TaxID=6661 RepID=A0AA88H1K0_ARTSF|nr:hypothetical protein QYM36_019112 [Artemia franciscana]
MISNFNTVCTHHPEDYSRTILQDDLREHFNKAYPYRPVKWISVVHDTEKVSELNRERNAAFDAAEGVCQHDASHDQRMKMNKSLWGFRQVRHQAILKAMSEKRGHGTDIYDDLTEEKFAKAVHRLGYKDTLPSLVEVRQKYHSYRIRKTCPVEPVVEEILLQCVFCQSWIGLTLAKSLEKDAGMGFFASLPFMKNQVVIEYHGKRMASVEAKQLIQETPERCDRRNEDKKPKGVGDASSRRTEDNDRMVGTTKKAREIQTHDDSSSESGVSVIYERVEEKKAEKTRQLTQFDCVKDITAAAKRIVAAKEQIKPSKKKKKTNYD